MQIMRLLRHYSIIASSLAETVIAMAIIAICLAVGMVIFSNTISTGPDVGVFKSRQQVKELLFQTRKNKSFENESYTYDEFMIEKRVRPIIENKLYELAFVVKSRTQRTDVYSYYVNAE